MNLFTWKTKYGTYNNCKFVPRHYCNPKNKALEVYDDEGCITTLTVNTDEILESDEIMIKNYSEGEGNDKLLIKEKIIKSEPLRYVRSGFVVIPIYRLTKKGMELWKDQM